MEREIKPTDRFEVWLCGGYKSSPAWIELHEINMEGRRPIKDRKRGIRARVARAQDLRFVLPKSLEACWDRTSDMMEFWNKPNILSVTVYFLDGTSLLLDTGDYRATTPRLHRNLCEAFGVSLPVEMYEEIPEHRQRCKIDYPNQADRNARRRPTLPDATEMRFALLELD